MDRPLSCLGWRGRWPVRQARWPAARTAVAGRTENDKGPLADVEERTRSAHRAIESGSPPASPCWGHCSRTTWRTRYWPGWPPCPDCPEAARRSPRRCSPGRSGTWSPGWLL